VRSKIWDAKPKVPWDGETPLCEWDGDRYFFDADAVADYIGDFLDDGGSVEDIRLVLARKMEPREFCMEDWCDDYTGEDGPDFPDTTEINKAVNDWIKANLNYLWEPSSQAVDPHSLPVPELSDIEVIDSTPLEREESA
jgi:hypothetical protein